MEEGGGCVLFDPQFSTVGGIAAPWDLGMAEIQGFIDSHKCYKFCRRLLLPPLDENELPLSPRPKPKPLCNSSVVNINKEAEALRDGIVDGEFVLDGEVAK